MSEFTQHMIESAPEEAKPMLEGVQKGLGFVPNMLGYMAESPALLKAYTSLNEIYNETDLSPIERQVVLLTVSCGNGCHYCMAAHTSIAQMQKVPAEVTRALRDGTAIDEPKLEALRAFTAKMVESRGFPDQSDIGTFLEAGYSKQNILDVILGIGLKTLSNYTNHVVDTEVDDAFAANVWQG